MAEQPFDLSRFPVHLGLGATVEHLPEFDGSPDWYERYGTAHASDGAEGRLVSLHTFDAVVGLVGDASATARSWWPA